MELKYIGGSDAVEVDLPDGSYVTVARDESHNFPSTPVRVGSLHDEETGELVYDDETGEPVPVMRPFDETLAEQEIWKPVRAKKNDAKDASEEDAKSGPGAAAADASKDGAA